MSNVMHGQSVGAVRYKCEFVTKQCVLQLAAGNLTQAGIVLVVL